MSHLDYYKFQVTARGVQSVSDIVRDAEAKAYLYDRIILPWLPLSTEARIVELACGHGSFLCWLKNKNFSHVTGIDSSAEQVHFARQINRTVQKDDAIKWLAEQPPETFDAIVAIDFVEHLPKDEFMEFLRATKAALAPGGSLILRLPNGDSPFVGRNLFNDITHVWTYTPNCLNSLAQMHEFTRTEFVDEGADAVRDLRWVKVPLAKFSAAILRALIQAATREKIQHLSPNLWARLMK